METLNVNMSVFIPSNIIESRFNMLKENNVELCEELEYFVLFSEESEFKEIFDEIIAENNIDDENIDILNELCLNELDEELETFKLDWLKEENNPENSSDEMEEYYNKFAEDIIKICHSDEIAETPVSADEETPVKAEEVCFKFDWLEEGNSDNKSEEAANKSEEAANKSEEAANKSEEAAKNPKETVKNSEVIEKRKIVIKNPEEAIKILVGKEEASLPKPVFGKKSPIKCKFGKKCRFEAQGNCKFTH